MNVSGNISALNDYGKDRLNKGKEILTENYNKIKTFGQTTSPTL